MDLVIERIRQVAARGRRGIVIGGWAALWVHGLRPPFVSATDGFRDLPVDVLAPASLGVEPVRGSRLRCYVDAAPPTVRIAGLEVTAPGVAVVDAARWQRTDAACLGLLDAGLRHGLVSQEELVELVRAMPRLHGVRRLRATLGWASGRAESAMESVARWWWLSTGIGWPLVNADVYDRDGQFVGRPDLLDPATGLCGEYQGSEHHAGAGSRRRDAERFRRFHAAGLTPVEIWGPDIASGRVVAELRAGLAASSSRRRRFVVAPAEDVQRLRVGLLAASGWGEPVGVSAPVERLYG